MNCLKIPLIVFITGLSIGLVFAQNETAQPYNIKVFCYDSAEVAKIAEIIIENEMMKENEKLYIQKDSLKNINRIILEEKISSLREIINLKNEQIIKMENTPLTVIDKSWKWWQYTLAAIGAVTFGFTAGIIYENMKQ